MKFKTINPATEEIIAEYETISEKKVGDIVEKCNTAYLSWKELQLTERIDCISNLAKILRKNKEKYANIITTEMGKPIRESKAEIEKCAWTAEVYVENTLKWLEEENVTADGRWHRVIFQPLGVILSIMP